MAQSKVKHKTAFPGVRYREHPVRKNGAVNKDRYYTIRYKVDGKDREEGVGWALPTTHKRGWTSIGNIHSPVSPLNLSEPSSFMRPIPSPASRAGH